MPARADAWTKICAVLCAGAVVAGAVGTVTRAAAVWEEVAETGRPGLLTLNTASSTPMWTTLSPGESTHWLIAAVLHTAPEGTLQLEVSVSGELVAAGDPSFSMRGCPAGFTQQGSTPVCPGGGETIIAETPLASVMADDRLIDLRGIVRGEPRELLVTLSLPPTASAEAVDGKVTHVGLGVHAAGDSPGVSPAPPVTPHLAMTGGDAVPLVLLAAGLIGTAICVRALRAPERARERT
ncbi:hypothetical protein MUN76_07770 [Leucobacter rhizosphaerae]|uniref:LPXTG cell wall anchor domain-containing protein n=1 Tax=Leucobacter rhizosphaerae TaxID=2932245 RepID=A0ABY4FRU5_9MICO|nr:hypothetical protein [Leucobacter rhizosphaerae]UOQ58972.1 hypothetical protein MUN76_07770 [Leucobacter rhizosphaerae]